MEMVSKFAFPFRYWREDKTVKKFSILPRISGIGIKVYGDTVSQLFENAAHGLYSYLISPVENQMSFHKEIVIEGADHESLLVQWLNELLLCSYSKNVMVTLFNILEITPTSLKAEVWGRKLSHGSNWPYEIKAVMSHDIKIRKVKNGFNTKVVFDV